MNYSFVEKFYLALAVFFAMWMIGAMIGHIPIISIPLGGLMLNRYALMTFWWAFIGAFLVTCSIVAVFHALFIMVGMCAVLGVVCAVKAYTSYKHYTKGWW